MNSWNDPVKAKDAYLDTEDNTMAGNIGTVPPPTNIF